MITEKHRRGIIRLFVLSTVPSIFVLLILFSIPFRIGEDDISHSYPYFLVWVPVFTAAYILAGRTMIATTGIGEFMLNVSVYFISSAFIAHLSQLNPLHLIIVLT
jgi:hypothetical protein